MPAKNLLKFSKRPNKKRTLALGERHRWLSTPRSYLVDHYADVGGARYHAQRARIVNDGHDNREWLELIGTYRTLGAAQSACQRDAKQKAKAAQAAEAVTKPKRQRKGPSNAVS